MSFQDELAPKVAEIERLAREMYETGVRERGLVIAEDGSLVNDPDTVSPITLDLEHEELLYQSFLSNLEHVRSRFELYYYLDTNEMVDLTAKIGGLKDASSDNTPYTAFDRIDHADDEWMRPVLASIIRGLGLVALPAG